MGIPYYFASLIRKHRNLVTSVKGVLTPDILAIDFNCLIHTYMKDETPIQSIVDALRTLLTEVCSATKCVYIAMDGLVPYAKMVQQRYRRFRVSETPSVFDRHQISPETPFMKELSRVIRETFPQVILSSTDEPGEGEHKLLHWLKTVEPASRRSICVYGLDADLILLCLSQMHLSKPYSFTLLRETTVFQQKTDTPGYSTLSVWGLSDVLDIPVEQYIRLCILCFGNDFMPMLGMFSLREGGHERALEMYSKCGQPDMSTSRGVMRFVTYAKQFETPLLMSKVLERDKRSEKSIVSSDGAYLEQRYNEHVLDGVVDIQPVVAAFWKTYIWTVRYFTTNEVPDWTWHYPYPDAPLVSQLSVYHEPTFNTDPPTFGVVQQLQFILPMTSLRTTKKRVLYPNEMYNEETDMRFPWMRRYAWESKPRISLPWSPSGTETKIEVFRR
jgi:hypothetical protein